MFKGGRGATALLFTHAKSSIHTSRVWYTRKASKVVGDIGAPLSSNIGETQGNCVDASVHHIVFIESGDTHERVSTRGGGLGSSTIFKNLMSPTPRRKWYLTTGRRAH